MSTNETPKTGHVFKLSDNLHEGTLHDELQELFKKMRKLVKECIQIDDFWQEPNCHPSEYIFNILISMRILKLRKQ